MWRRNIQKPYCCFPSSAQLMEYKRSLNALHANKFFLEFLYSPVLLLSVRMNSSNSQLKRRSCKRAHDKKLFSLQNVFSINLTAQCGKVRRKTKQQKSSTLWYSCVHTRMCQWHICDCCWSWLIVALMVNENVHVPY